MKFPTKLAMKTPSYPKFDTSCSNNLVKFSKDRTSFTKFYIKLGEIINLSETLDVDGLVQLLVSTVARPQHELFKYLSLTFLSIVLVILAYYSARIIVGLDELFPLGENLVTREIPSPDISFIYAKPITYIVLFTMLSWLFGLEAMRDKFIGLSDFWIRILMIIACFIAFIGGYEALWNFFMWSTVVGSIAKEGKLTQNPDLLANIYPNPDFPVNFLFATKVFSLMFFAAIYFMIFLLTIIWRKERSG